jgi:hypothetical protein
VRRSYGTVAADYVARVKPPADLDPLSRAMLAAFAERQLPGPPTGISGKMASCLIMLRSSALT